MNGESGGGGETDTLLDSVYDELRRLAAYQLNRERPNHTLQATALVHEAYLRLAAQENSKWSGRVHFIAMASEMMRRVLVDYAREHLREKRGGGLDKLSLSEAAELVGGRDVELLDLDRALGRLAEIDPRKAKLVELRYFGGLTYRGGVGSARHIVGDGRARLEILPRFSHSRTGRLSAAIQPHCSRAEPFAITAVGWVQDMSTVFPSLDNRKSMDEPLKLMAPEQSSFTT